MGSVGWLPRGASYSDYPDPRKRERARRTGRNPDPELEDRIQFDNAAFMDVLQDITLAPLNVCR